MSESTHELGRRRDRKQDDVVATLRSRICTGIHGAGAALPTVRELALELDASVPTVSRALGLLIEQGFISTDGRRGTHVVEHPPHLHHVALVLPDLPDAHGHYANLHWQSLAGAARQLGSNPIASIETFHALNRHHEMADHQRLVAAVRDQRLAGLVLCEPFQGDEWLDLDQITVPIIGSVTTTRPDRGVIRLNQSDFRRRALAHIRACGRRRLAVVMDASLGALHAISELRAAVRDYGIECPAHHILAAPLSVPGWARHAAHAVMQGPEAQRPDALLVCDDNLVDEAIIGLDAAGVSADALDLVTHANFPSTPPTGWAVTRFGWDQCEFLRDATQAIADWHQYGKPLGQRTLAVRREDEIGGQGAAL